MPFPGPASAFTNFARFSFRDSDHFWRGPHPIFLGVPSNSILDLFRKPSKAKGNSRFLKRTMVEKNGGTSLPPPRPTVQPPLARATEKQNPPRASPRTPGGCMGGGGLKRPAPKGARASCQCCPAQNHRKVPVHTRLSDVIGQVVYCFVDMGDPTFPNPEETPNPL